MHFLAGSRSGWRRADSHDLPLIVPIHVRFQCIHLLAAQWEWLALIGNRDTPAHHLLHRRHMPYLRLVLRIGLRMGDGSIGVTHIAGLSVSAHGKISAVPELVP